MSDHRYSNDRKDFANYLSGYRLRPNHNLGQNFIYDKGLLQAMVAEMRLPPTCEIWEIGAGTGNLTAVLAEQFPRVTAIEIDPALARPLQDRFTSNPKVRLIFGDALKLTAADLANSEEENSIIDNIAVVGNLPYYISTKLIEHFLLHFHAALQYSFLVQQEFVDRILTPAGSKNYGPLNILLDNFTTIRKGMTLSATDFMPQPSVSSTLIHIIPQPNSQIDKSTWPDYRNFLHLAFAQRRKTMHNTYARLQREYPLLNNTNDLEWLAGVGLKPQIRPEAITPENWLTLYKTAIGIESMAE